MRRGNDIEDESGQAGEALAATHSLSDVSNSSGATSQGATSSSRHQAGRRRKPYVERSEMRMTIRLYPDQADDMQLVGALEQLSWFNRHRLIRDALHAYLGHDQSMISDPSFLSALPRRKSSVGTVMLPTPTTLAPVADVVVVSPAPLLAASSDEARHVEAPATPATQFTKNVATEAQLPLPDPFVMSDTAPSADPALAALAGLFGDQL